MSSVYILGAGASKFAGFPLASELLPVLRQELHALSHEMGLAGPGKNFIEFIDRVSPHLLERYLYNNEPDIEFVMSLPLWATSPASVECSPELHRDLDDVCKQANLWSPMRRTEVEGGCNTLISNALERKCVDAKNSWSMLGNVILAWTNRVQAGDCIITFNWDVLNEMMFLQAGKWHWRDGYGFIVQNPTTSQASSSIQILKLHGSINWAAHGSHIWVDDQSSSFFDLTPDEV